jgi:hypothetical protein
MPLRVFFSWQSDRPQKRNFIRTALDTAAKQLNFELTLEDAIADAILTKIRSADAFVADLTFVDDGESAERRKLPNPNVMLEYGYALHALGDSKIVGLFNDSYGHPNQLPFDLSHRRWPIRFTQPTKATEQKTDERKRLVNGIKEALRAIVSQFGAPIGLPAVATPFASFEPGDGVGRMRSTKDYLCVARTSDEKPIWLPQGPYAFLRLIPTSPVPELGEVETYKIAQANLQPMGGMRGGGWNAGRHQTGTVVYWTDQENPQRAWDASQLFLTREIWANDYYHVFPDQDRAKELGFPFIPTGAVEEVFIDTLINFISVAQEQLALSPPLRLSCGLAGVKGFRLAVDPRYFHYDQFVGKILRENVTMEKSLLPLFHKIYDAAGVRRPNTRTVGRRQR